MLAHASTQSRASRPTIGGSRPFGRGLIVALATFAIITGIEVSDLRARSGIQPSGDTVNRTLKGDRLPAASVSHPNAVRRPHEKSNAARETASVLKLPDGCESLVSSLVNRQLARIASRCVS